MNLQLALDRLSWAECFRLVRETQADIDIIEIGTGVIKEYGMVIVRTMRQEFPEHMLLADMKICDAGKHEAKQAFDAGADIATVMAFASKATIRGAQEMAGEYDKEMMVDLLEVHDRKKVEQLKADGVSFVGLHIGKDEQKKQALGEQVFQLVEGLHLKTAVAGGVTLEALPSICRESPDVVIAGSAITKAERPEDTARSMKEQIRKYQKG